MLPALVKQIFKSVFPRGSQAQSASRHTEKGWSKLNSGDLDSAEILFNRSLSRAPKDRNALHGLVEILSQRGERKRAAEILVQLVRAFPDDAHAWTTLGYLRFESNELARALACADGAIKVAPNDPHAHNIRGLVMLETRQFQEASWAFERATQLNPSFAQAWSNFGAAYLQLGKRKEGMDYFQRALGLDPKLNAARINYGLACRESGDYELATSLLETALEFDPNSAEAHANLGLVYQDRRQFEKALAAYEHASRLNPGDPEIDRKRAYLYLLKHDFQQGWPAYESRLRTADATFRSFPLPVWDGSPIPDKTILVYGEQGLGDEIMFASCIPDIVAQAGHCILECVPRLAPIFSRSFPDATVIGRLRDQDMAWLNQLPKQDFCFPAGSLPLHFRRALETFPRHSGYLKADANKIARWKDRLASLGTGLKIGVSWQGGTPTTRQHLRGIELAELLPIFELPNTTFISLQYTDCAAKLEEFRTQTGITIHHWQELIDDYEETAALVSALDLVISVCTAIIHLGGALGKPVWILVPASPEWRYGIMGDAMPWYPSARMFRQDVLNQWGPVVKVVAEEVARLPHRNDVRTSC